jgi:uncharacterized membrane protein YhaH (DUF805 family)
MKWLIEFVFLRRLHRVDYCLRVLTSNFMMFFLYGNNWLFNPGLCFWLMIFLVIYSIFFIVMPRIRDLGMSGWFCLLVLIPLVDIVFGIILLLRAPKYQIGSSIGVIDPKSE